ncbi:hypothetical protein NQ314_006377, partial [Rhamnusium bicolor]
NVKFEHEGIHRQARFGYGPLLGLLLANFLSNSAIAKYAPLGALRLSYEPTPWLSQNDPTYDSHSSYDPYNYWHPIKNPYGPPLPPPTSAAETTDAQHFHHHHHINPPPNQQQIVNINERPSAEIVIEDDDSDTDPQKVDANLENPHIVEPIAAESIISPIQVSIFSNNDTHITPKPKNPVKRGAPSRFARRNKNNSHKHRRYTTTPEYDYDSYEDFSTTSRYKPKRKTEPRRPIDSDEEGSEEYDYDLYDFTTKPYRKRRRTTSQPKRNKNKIRKNQQVVTTTVDDYDYDRAQPVTQIVFRQSEFTTTPSTMIINGTDDATSTTTTTTTTEATTNSTNTTGYGK